MSGIPDLPRKADTQSFWERYHSDAQFRAEVDTDHAMMSDAPFLEMAGMISLVQLQTTVAYGKGQYVRSN